MTNLVPKIWALGPIQFQIRRRLSRKAPLKLNPPFFLSVHWGISNCWRMGVNSVFDCYRVQENPYKDWLFDLSKSDRIISRFMHFRMTVLPRSLPLRTPLHVYLLSTPAECSGWSNHQVRARSQANHIREIPRWLTYPRSVIKPFWPPFGQYAFGCWRWMLAQISRPYQCNAHALLRW